MKNIFFIPLVLIVMLIGTYFIQTKSSRYNFRKELPVSLPEELPVAKEGDTLYIIGVSDSIYIGFKNYKKL